MEKKCRKLPLNCQFIQLPRVEDERGSLAFGECGKHIPFQIERIFWTYDVKDCRERGDHAHRTCSMVLFPLGGSYDIEVDDGQMKVLLHMDDPSEGILIPPGVWCRLRNFSEHAACISLASEPYDPQDYIHDYNEFLTLVKR